MLIDIAASARCAASSRRSCKSWVVGSGRDDEKSQGMNYREEPRPPILEKRCCVAVLFFEGFQLRRPGPRPTRSL